MNLEQKTSNRQVDAGGGASNSLRNCCNCIAHHVMSCLRFSLSSTSSYLNDAPEHSAPSTSSRAPPGAALSLPLPWLALSPSYSRHPSREHICPVDQSRLFVLQILHVLFFAEYCHSLCECGEAERRVARPSFSVCAVAVPRPRRASHRT